MKSIKTRFSSTSKDQLSPYVNNKTPAFATLIIKNNKTIFKGVQGSAVLENDKCITKATLNTPFSICSVTKHFTAALILMLEEEGKLSTEDFISKHIPHLPEKFKDIKIKHLIFHISGIPEYFGDPSIRDFDQMIKEGKQLNDDVVFKFILKSELQPHSKAHAYCNSGYALLTRIIQNVSGQSYSQFIKERIFDPLEMKTAFMISELNKHSHYAQAYSAWPLYTPTLWMKAAIPIGEGGIFMSINDMEKWVYAFNHYKIFRKKKTMQKFLSIGKYDDGKELIIMGSAKYGFGLMHTEDYRNGKKYKVIIHNGGMPGSAATFCNLRHKDDNIWVVFFNSASSYPNAFEILDQLQIGY